MRLPQLTDEHMLPEQSDASAPTLHDPLHSHLPYNGAEGFANFDDSAPLDLPPSYEQSVLASPSVVSTSSSSSSNPYLRNHRGFTSTPPQDLLSSEQAFAPRLAQRHAPSAPPLTLLATTSGRPEAALPVRRHTTDQHASAAPALSSSSVRKGKRPVQAQRRDHHATFDNINNDDGSSITFEGQPAVSPSYVHPLDSSPAVGYSSSSSRTARRLELKQATARHAASAPDLYPHHQHTSSSSTASIRGSSSISNNSNSFMPTATLPLSQSVVPAPPPRLLQFRSREPSSVPACPYPLCQKPIALTKTRRERGVTVWIVCGLLFLCNTYWTTQAVISQFSNSNSKDRILSQNAMKATDARWTVRGEASHLVKGFLGFKTHRYKTPKMVDYQRHMMELKRPFVATVGVVQDEQNGIRMLLSFIVMVVMAIIRWWLCLTPLLVRPLFDTVHICPHAHPYPYPEEIELERRTLEGEPLEEEGLNSRIGTTVQHASSTDTMSATLSRDGYGDEKKRLRERDEADAAAAVGRPNGQAQRRQSGQGSVTEPSTASIMTATTGVVSGSGSGFAPESAPPGPAMSRFRFFRRVRTIQQELKEEGHRRVREIQQELQEQGRRRVREIQQELREQGQQALSATMTQIKKKSMSSRAERAIKKAQERRNKVIKASQDIGRYSLLYQLGALFKMDGWKQAVLAPTKIQSEAYED